MDQLLGALARSLTHSLLAVQHDSRHGGNDRDGNDKEYRDPESSVCPDLTLHAHSVTERRVTLVLQISAFKVVSILDVNIFNFGRCCQVLGAEVTLAPTTAADLVVTLASSSGLSTVFEAAGLR